MPKSRGGSKDKGKHMFLGGIPVCCLPLPVACTNFLHTVVSMMLLCPSNVSVCSVLAWQDSN